MCFKYTGNVFEKGLFSKHMGTCCFSAEAAGALLKNLKKCVLARFLLGKVQQEIYKMQVGKMEIETMTMQLIVNSGDARSRAMEAIALAKKGELGAAREKLEESRKFLTQAHQFQTDLIQEEADGNIKSVSLLTAHSQDHLMNAITVSDMAGEFVDLYEMIFHKKGAD